MNTRRPPRPVSSLEALETRIAPATLLFQFTDADGHLVKLSASKGSMSDLHVTTVVNDVSTPIAANGTATAPVLIQLGPSFKGADLTIVAGDTAQDSATTKVALLDATGLDLGKVRIDGELDKIDAGDGNSATQALASLSVSSFGRADNSLPSQSNPTELDSSVVGGIKTFIDSGDFRGAALYVHGSDSLAATPPAHKTDADGKIGSIFIGGSVLGTARTLGGSILTSGDIGSVTVVGSVKGFASDANPQSDPGGQNQNGRIFSGGAMGKVTIGTSEVTGNVIGGDGKESGQIAAAKGIASVTVNGSILGGLGQDSGAIGAGGPLGMVVITKDLKGGSGERSGAILSSTTMLSVNIGGDVEGGSAKDSGFVASAGTLASVSIGGHLKGGSGPFSGSVGSFGALGKVAVTGDLIGGSAAGSGQIVSASEIGAVSVHNLIGGDDFEAGTIGSTKAIGSVTVTGSIDAGTGERSGLITTGSPDSGSSIGLLPSAPIGSVTVKGSVIGQPLSGSAGFESGGIESTGDLGDVVILGNLSGGDNSLTGFVASGGKINSVQISGDLIGGTGSQSGFIATVFQLRSISTTNPKQTGHDIGTVFIGGSILANTNSSAGSDASSSASIYSSGKLNSVVVGDPNDTSAIGDVVGGAAPQSGTIFSRQAMGNVAIKRDLVGGSTSETGLVDASSIAKVTIGRNVQGGSSDFSGGIETYRSDIGSVVIGGALLGGEGATLNSGFVAAEGSLKSLTAAAITGTLSSARPVVSAVTSIDSVTVTQGVQYTDILAGYSPTGNGVNPSADIGTVVVGTANTKFVTWTATNVVAGAATGPDGNFGERDDVSINSKTSSGGSKINSVIINGSVTPTSSIEDHFGIVADQVVAVKVAGAALNLSSKPNFDHVDLTSSDDTSVFELGSVPNT